ncbi:MAG: hypothetical protein AAGN46_13415 [Acidobacteriota bacterium]
MTWQEPHPDQRLQEQTVRFVLLTIGIMVALNIVSSILAVGWISAVVTTGIIFSSYLVYVVVRRDRFLAGWVVLGVVAGFLELFADAWLVGTGSLIYPQGEPMLWKSPAYMPFAWANVLIQIGAIGHVLRHRLSLPLAILATCMLSGLNIPLYEMLAKHSGWWHYVDTPMIFGAPYYILLAEFLIGGPMVLVSMAMDEKPITRALPLGVVVGIGLFLVCPLAWWLLGPCQGAVIQLPCS